MTSRLSKAHLSNTLRAAALAAPLLFVASGALAHAHILKANPAENAVISAPAVLHLEFSEKLEPKFSGVELMKASGTPVPVASKAIGAAIDATPKAALAPGAYMVMWHALSVDGHKSSGDYNFTVK
ncbi:copper homeostasis periplasmic binding protein CopC [Phenylobacterium sp.]|uniref:copper homeostasis periplasmic binding protein CopC n=1 Tax=Phenylobacterium sp. TaxID=1871053 RepID=UPI0025D4B286|nr:copper homeostasis periplasmic binding protein CopC [Phenylobacterium sp.]